MDADTLAKLRIRVREEVVAALKRLESLEGGKSLLPAAVAPRPGRVLVSVLMGHDPVNQEYFSQLSSLARQGFALVVVASRTFTQFHATALQNLPAGATLHPEPDHEPGLFALVDGAAGVVAHSLSANSAAKIAAGINDSVPSRVFARALPQGKPVFVAQDIAAAGRQYAEANASAPPPVTRAFEDSLHRIQQFGVRFVDCAGLSEAVQAAFYVPVNETPERLARTRPTMKREFITAEDVWKAFAAGHKELVFSASAVVTDQAREYAEGRGVTLRVQE